MSVPLPIAHLPLAEQDTLVLLTMCIWAEARNQSYEGKLAVACVVRNRVLQAPRYGSGWGGVILAPKQFSWTNPGDPNLPRALEPDRYGTPWIWRECGEIAEGVYRGDIKDITGGADHYHTIAKPRSVRSWPPKWAGEMKKTRVIGDHIFYRA